MNKIKWPLILLVANLAAISWVAIRFLNLHYPIVGDDYGLILPQMLDTLLHHRMAGLGIQWYTPTFGGGLPAYPNPNNAQFSLLMMLPLLVGPWQAVTISTIIFIFLSGGACYYLFKNVLKLHWTSSLMGSIFFIATGFTLERIAVGHVFYQTFLLLPIILIALLDPSIHWSIAGVMLALVLTTMIHEASFMLIVIFGLSTLVVLPMVYIYRPDAFSWKRLASVTAMGGVAALLASASKLSAVYAFMRFFPRQVADYYPTSPVKALLGLVMQLLGTMNLFPVLRVLGVHSGRLDNLFNSVTGAVYGYWEFDMSMSPLVFGLLLVGIFRFFKRPIKNARTLIADKRWIAWLLLIFFSWLTVEFTLAKGWIYPLLRDLPILSSLHVNPRFASAFLFPLAFCAAVIYDRWAAGWSGRKSLIVFTAINALTLLSLGSFFFMKGDLQKRDYDVTEAQGVYTAIRAGDSLDITGISADASNTQALERHVSNLHPYEPVFGYGLEDFHPEIHAGSIWDVSDGYYNMTNPTGYVFPEINGTRSFERIPVSDRDKLEAFASHKQPDWKIPLYQQVLDWVSGLTVLTATLFLAFVGVRQLIPRLKKKR